MTSSHFWLLLFFSSLSLQEGQQVGGGGTTTTDESARSRAGSRSLVEPQGKLVGIVTTGGPGRINENKHLLI